jgi:glyoxylase-like metal-dependent hydrolase (beta-lactamase superfamily II)
MTALNRFDDELFWSTPDAALDRPVIGLIAASGGTLMFDACGSHRHAVELQREMDALGFPTPDLCVISHSHADHWFGLVDFDAPAVASRACQAATMAMTTMDWTHEGYRHLVDDGVGNAFLAVILRIPQKKIVFLGDVLYLRGNDEQEIREVLAELDRLDAEWFIGGHVDGVLTRDQVEVHLREYVRSL